MHESEAATPAQIRKLRHLGMEFTDLQEFTPGKRQASQMIKQIEQLNCPVKDAARNSGILASCWRRVAPTTRDEDIPF